MSDVCTGCGEPNPPGTQFCLFCGIYLGWEDRDGEPPGDPAPRGRSVTGAAEPPDDAAGADETGVFEIDRTQEISVAASTGAAAGATVWPTPADGGPADGRPAATRAPATTPAAGACPTCGRVNDPSRRFCGHCGTVLTTGAPVRAPAPRRRSWWERLLRSDTRIARQAYRRSLPAVYRWRRVAVVAVLALLVGGAFAVVRRDPVSFAVDRWQDLTNALEPVQDVSAVAEPETSLVGDSTAGDVLDADPLTAWVIGWVPPEEPAACGAAPGGRLVLTFPATRVRELQVITGVTDPSERLLQHVPTQLHVLLPDSTCQTVSLGRQAEVQTVPFDTGEPVTRLTFSVGAVHTADDERVEDVAGLSRLTLVARPARGG